MNKNINICVFFFMIISISFLSGCSQKYGKIVYESRYNAENVYEDESKMTLQKLGEDWENYHIYYSGVDPTRVGGVLFDPKNDDKTIETVNYKKALKKETLEELVRWNTGATVTGRLYQILGYDGQFFGYIYHPNVDARPSVRIIDENTIEVTAWRYYGEGDTKKDK